MSVSDLIEPIGNYQGDFTLPAANDWLQGRTMYGGASTLIAYISAKKSFPDLPPLRAGQVGFIAPIGDEIALDTNILRQGRNVTQLRSDILVGGKVALNAFFLFGAKRPSNGEHHSPRAHPWPGDPQDAEAVMVGKGPNFLQQNIELRRAQENSGAGEPIMRRWIRLKQRDEFISTDQENSPLDRVAELLLLGDTLPPSAVRKMERQGPISSINWSFNVLDNNPTTRDGWWLAETSSEYIKDGYSSERLRLWNTDGQLVLTGLQLVAVFG